MSDFLLAWVLVPVELSLLAVGCGLLVAAVASRTGAPRAEPFPALLVPPVGFALVVVVTALATTWETTAPLAGVAPAVLAVAGFVVGRARLAGWWRRRGRAGWAPGAAGGPAAGPPPPRGLARQAGVHRLRPGPAP